MLKDARAEIAALRAVSGSTRNDRTPELKAELEKTQVSLCVSEVHAALCAVILTPRRSVTCGCTCFHSTWILAACTCSVALSFIRSSTHARARAHTRAHARALTQPLAHSLTHIHVCTKMHTQGKLREALQLVVDTSAALDKLRGKVEVKSAALNNHFGIRSSSTQENGASVVAR